MDRTTVELPPRLKQELLDVARRDGISFGELVRRTMEREMKHPISSSEVFAPPRRRAQRSKSSSVSHLLPPLVHETVLASATREYLDIADLYDIYI